MELIFIRHGHGEHLLDYPNRLNSLHPGLTEYGVHQIYQLKNQISILPDDLVIVSPTKRTIQTAEQLMGEKEKPYFVSPFVGPRMYPQNPDSPFFGCDQIYSRKEIHEIIREERILDFGLKDWGEGINRMDQDLFMYYGMQLLEWCISNSTRAYIISHDGTITNYRWLLGEEGLTRNDFLGEAGIYQTYYESNANKS
ncbi:phosphoglycerate mutase family protein [Paenibacillus physcomitrellae]|uniref:Histidine phosphatase family protein n=1 Tax=Paenibacillus physcomitrellae TaxID=1619311 RepID=A0ABQ1FK94_9BACL|nr:histidine phosphatase family protein [Paenibacillus physcomitrellae]GGA19406.1 histidine phosphatase family protein [Paenibacillus physcomitrellae]